MKGKVKCTCGWEWNKSDSSKKDMYICHECGRDNSNNMKNGGWLDNYNDSQASAPEGMVGDGFSNVGRNYSPAWGGQFQNGGKAPKYVESKNDPRYRAYQDSLNLYNYSNKQKLKGNDNSRTWYPYDLDDQQKELKKAIKNKEEKSYGYIKVPNTNIYRKMQTSNNINIKDDDNLYPNSYDDQHNNDEYVHPNIKPIDSYAWGSTKSKSPNGNVNFTYKKPQQDVIVQNNKKYNSLKTNNPNLYNTKLINGDVPRYADGTPVYTKKPQQQVIVQRPKLEELQNNLQPEGLVHGNLDIEAELPQIRQQVRQPKYYDVEDYTQGSTNYIGNQTNYRTEDLSTLSEQSPNNTRKITPHYQMGGSVYPVNYVPEAAMGGSLPGATGHMYARYEQGGLVPGDVGFSYPRIGEIPSNGPYAKKTMASAQNGKEMQYYQNGLDWKPKSISRDGSVIKDDRGQWEHPGEITEIGSNQITMEGVPYDVLGISDTGDVKLMKPGKDYKFKGKKVTEFPMAKNGLRQEQKGLQNLDNLTNFTNYNKPQPGSWLEKYN